MSKVSQSNSLSHRIKVNEGGEIFLDTGNQSGKVVVTGDLEINGNNFAIGTSNLQIGGNILTLSNGTQGNGLPSSDDFVSGIKIDRGSLVNAKWLFDEQVNWSLGGTSGSGTFYAIAGNQKLPLNTPGIVTQDSFYVDPGSGVISVTNTSSYESRIFNYGSNGLIENFSGTSTPVIDNDNVPNTKALTDYVNFALTQSLFDSISEGNTKIETQDQIHKISDVQIDGNTTIITTNDQHRFLEGFFVDISGIQASGDPLENLNGNDIEILKVIDSSNFRVDVDISNANTNLYNGNGIVKKDTALEPRIILTSNGNNIANLFEDRFEVSDLRIKNNILESIIDNQDLIIRSLDTGIVKIDDVLEIPKAPNDSGSFDEPLPPLDGSRLYTKNEKQGGTGVYFVNENNTRDELVSKRKALFYSLMQ